MPPNYSFTTTLRFKINLPISPVIFMTRSRNSQKSTWTRTRMSYVLSCTAIFLYKPLAPNRLQLSLVQVHFLVQVSSECVSQVRPVLQK